MDAQRLNELVANGDYELAIKHSQKLLESTMNDEQRDKLSELLFCLYLHNEDFKAAWKMQKEYSSLKSTKYTFERAYCLYRLGYYHECLRMIEGQSDLKFLLLKAQALYRANKFSEALKVYEEEAQPLFSKVMGGENSERLVVNILATKACLTTLMPEAGQIAIGQVKDMSQSHEAQFNAASWLAATGNYQEALELLKVSMEWVRKSLQEDGYEETEIETELVPYKLQYAFLVSKLLEPQQELVIQQSLHAVIRNGKGDNRRIAKFNLKARKRQVTNRVIKHLLGSTKLGFTQRPHAMLHLAWTRLRKAGLQINQPDIHVNDPTKIKAILSSARILRRQLLRPPATQAIASALLLQALRMLPEMGHRDISQEISAIAKNSSLMRSLDLTWRCRCHMPTFKREMVVDELPATKNVLESLRIHHSGIRTSHLPSVSEDRINNCDIKDRHGLIEHEFLNILYGRR